MVGVDKATSPKASAASAMLVACALLGLGGCATQPAEPIYACELDGCYVYPGYSYRWPYSYGYGYGPHYSAYSYWGAYGGWWYGRPYYAGGYYGGYRPINSPVATAPSETPLPADTRVIPYAPATPQGASPDRRFPMSGSSSAGARTSAGSTVAPSSGGSRRSGGGSRVGGRR